MSSSYWRHRATVYNNLEWVRSKQFMREIIAAGNFRRSDVVLDAGTGTGIVAGLLAPLVKKVVAIDASPHMLGMASDGYRNIDWVVGDLREMKFADCTFDVAVARYVFHHIIDGTEKAMAECYRVIKNGGVMVFAEGVPPSERVKQDYIDIFKLKEQRLTFMVEDMVKLMVLAGFFVSQPRCIWLRQMSVRNWIESGGVPKAKQNTIYMMHKNAPQYFKDDYHMTETENDCLIDMKVVIMVGVK